MIHLTAHARYRIADRDLTEAVIEAVVSSPAVTGDAGRGTQFRCAPAVLGTRRAWVTVVVGTDEAGDECVVTAYRGMPERHYALGRRRRDATHAPRSPSRASQGATWRQARPAPPIVPAPTTGLGFRTRGEASDAHRFR